MKKRVLSILLVVILALSILPTYALAAGLSNFTKTKTYSAGQFTDVPATQWYSANVQTAYEYGLIDGTTPTTFSPGKNLTLAEAIKLAACLNSIYNTGTAVFEKGVTPWYQPYVDYALTNGIIKSAYPDYTALATRSDMAVIFAHALPDEAMVMKNAIDDDAIPDVSISFSYSPEVYKLYRAGILTGSDKGVFNPNSNITRDAVAAIVSRMASESLRQPLTLTAKALSATEIATTCSPAVFRIDLLSKTGETIRSGSGFFISSSGLAVTNYHVIENMISAKITMKDGKSYDVTGLYDFSEANDLALIQINGTDFPFLTLGNSDTVVTGASIYAIGYPLGIDQTVTPGIITNASHTEDDVNYIMINAPISPGSSGGVLLSSTGKVLGVTNGYYSDGQNLNLAVPINLLNTLSAEKPLTSLSTLFTKTFSYYAGYPVIPDITSIAGTSLYDQWYNSEYSAQYYVYSVSNSEDIYDVEGIYLDQLSIEGFEYEGYAENDGHYFYAFIDASGTWDILVGIVEKGGTEYIAVAISHAE